ncbi:MAG TPA: PrsW family glutamic-type intramembrane protease, partial [Solirubrobacteraceae bacterium]|nr:PrsW family glutamic-type intramembrane protease [Solirubrobacteraceae bacterium]
GLGFQIVEDVIYSLNGATSGLGMGEVDRALDVAAVRIGAGLTSHVVYSAIFCAGLMWLLGRDGNRRLLLGWVLVLYAMFAHFVWDSPAGLAGDDGQLQILFMGGIVVLDLVVLFFAVRTAARPERAWIRRILAPEVDRGAITEAELAAVSGTRRDRRRFLHRVDGGRRAGRHVLAAADDLAHSIAKDRAQGTDDAAFARSELARMRAAT